MLKQSPFPGLDPYLEPFWGDIHTSLMVYIRDQINDQLPSDLQARVEESISVGREGPSRWIFPDVKVSKQNESRPIASSNLAVMPEVEADVEVAEPLLIPVGSDAITQRHLTIIDLNSGNLVVTAIELLSPSNKIDEYGRNAYRRKQSEYLNGNVNLVEIDLIRGGESILATGDARIPWDQRSVSTVCIRRVTRPSIAELIPLPIDQSIPHFRIPLRPSDADVVLRLQPLLDDCYRRGRYASIDYTKRPRPKLVKQDEDWADNLLREKGRR